MVEPVLEEQFIAPGLLYLEFRDFAFLGPESVAAAEAARCADDQGKFWEYHDYLYFNQAGENQGGFDRPVLDAIAEALELDMAEFGACVDSHKYAQAVQDSRSEGDSLGIRWTPALILNDEVLTDLESYDALFQMIADIVNQGG